MGNQFFLKRHLEARLGMWYGVSDGNWSLSQEEPLGKITPTVTLLSLPLVTATAAHRTATSTAGVLLNERILTKTWIK